MVGSMVVDQSMDGLFYHTDHFPVAYRPGTADTNRFGRSDAAYRTTRIRRIQSSNPLPAHSADMVNFVYWITLHTGGQAFATRFGRAVIEGYGCMPLLCCAYNRRNLPRSPRESSFLSKLRFILVFFTLRVRIYQLQRSSCKLRNSLR